jgi:hypothetical protein
MWTDKGHEKEENWQKPVKKSPEQSRGLFHASRAEKATIQELWSSAKHSQFKFWSE